MAANVAEEIPVPSDISAEEGGSGLKFLLGKKKVKIFAVLVVVMVVQAAAFYLLLPQPASTAGRPNAQQSAGAGDPASQLDAVEVSIDSFNCTNSIADPGSVIHVSFRLVAVVANNLQLAFDTAANKEHKARVRQAVVTVARSSSLDDLNDPDLTTMKRLIREEVNKVLRKSYIIEVVISDFKTMEQ